MRVCAAATTIGGFEIPKNSNVVHEALTRTGRIGEPRMFLGAAVPPWGYRTTVRLAVASDGRVGFRSRRSHDVVTTDNCPVAHPKINEVIASLRVHGLREITLRVGLASNERTAMTREDGRFEGLASDVQVGTQHVVHETVAGRSFPALHIYQ